MFRKCFSRYTYFLMIVTLCFYCEKNQENAVISRYVPENISTDKIQFIETGQILLEETEVVEGRDTAIERLQDPALDLRRTALLHEALPEPLAPAPIDSASTAQVELLRFTPREIVWEVETDRPRLLVASEVYYPAGWTARIDDAPAPILRADYLLRAVPVPEGRHIVTMQFEPEKHERSILISGLATALVYIGALLLAGLVWYRKGD